jgi:hypothetical protein
MEFHEKLSGGSRAVPNSLDGKSDEQTDITELIVAFRNFRT